MESKKTEFNKTRERIESRRRCSHRTSVRLNADGVTMACCSGSGSTCKTEEIEYLIGLLYQKCERIDALEAQVKELHAKPTSVVHDNRVMNNFKLTVNTFALNGTGLVEAAMKGCDAYALAYRQILKMPDSEKKKELLEWSNSNDPCDKLNFRCEVMNLVKDAVDRDVESGKLQEGNHLNKINAIIEKEQDKIEEVANQLGMD